MGLSRTDYPLSCPMSTFLPFRFPHSTLVASSLEKQGCVTSFQHALSTCRNMSACDGIFKSAPQMIFAATADVVTLVKTMTAVCYWLFVAYTLADFCQYAIRPRSRESSARFSAHADSSVYIYIYNCGPLSWVQASKAGSPRGATGAKNDFWGVPVSEPSFPCLQAFPERVLRAFLCVFGRLWELLGTCKTFDSVQYILKKSSFQDGSLPRHLSVLPLKHFGAAGGVFGKFFGSLLAPLRPL